jgi:hypothetical protein
MIGIDIKYKSLDNLEDNAFQLEYQFEKLKSQIPNLVFVTEFRTGDHEKYISSNITHIMARLTLGHGMNAINYYMAVGGTNPKGMYKNTEFNYSAYPNTLKFDGSKYITDNSGQSFDFGAPIGEMGQKNNRYEVIKTFSKYLEQHKEGLITSEKVYDDIAILHYYPYTRINFDTKKLKCPINYNKYTREPDSATKSLLKSLNLLGIHPKLLDIQTSSIEQIQPNKIACIWLCNYMDIESLNKLLKFVENGGILISFGDIPTRDEMGVRNTTLMNIYRAAINSDENYTETRLFGESINTYDSFATYKFAKNQDDVKNESQFSPENLSEDDIISQKIDNNRKKITAFHRSFGNGHIYHFGFIFSSKSQSEDYIKKFLNKLNFSSRKTECSNNLSILRQKNPENEEYITVANLTQEDIESDTIIFNSSKNMVNNTDSIKLNALKIPKQTAIQWILNKKINSFAKIMFCSSEINKIQIIRRTTPIQHNIEAFHFTNSVNLFELELDKRPAKISFNGQDITKEAENSTNPMNVNLKEVTRFDNTKQLIITAKYSESIKLEVFFGEEKGFSDVVVFQSIKMDIFMD